MLHICCIAFALLPINAEENVLMLHFHPLLFLVTVEVYR